MWAVWNVHGKFQRFFSSKAEIQENYDQLVWRPMMASWKFRDIAERDVEKRKAVLEATMTESPAKRRAALRAV